MSRRKAAFLVHSPAASPDTLDGNSIGVNTSSQTWSIDS